MGVISALRTLPCCQNLVRESWFVGKLLQIPDAWCVTLRRLMSSWLLARMPLHQVWERKSSLSVEKPSRARLHQANVWPWRTQLEVVASCCCRATRSGRLENSHLPPQDN